MKTHRYMVTLEARISIEITTDQVVTARRAAKLALENFSQNHDIPVKTLKEAFEIKSNKIGER